MPAHKEQSIHPKGVQTDGWQPMCVSFYHKKHLSKHKEPKLRPAMKGP